MNLRLSFSLLLAQDRTWNSQVRKEPSCRPRTKLDDLIMKRTASPQPVQQCSIKTGVVETRCIFFSFSFTFDHPNVEHRLPELETLTCLTYPTKLKHATLMLMNPGRMTCPIIFIPMNWPCKSALSLRKFSMRPAPFNSTMHAKVFSKSSANLRGRFRG